MSDIDTVARWVQERDRFAIGSHVDPDGDSLGSSLALVLALEQLGKQATAVIGQSFPARYAWLPAADRVLSAPEAPPGCLAAILVECSDFARSGVTGLDAVDSLNIDHHTKNAMFGDLNWIDPSVASLGMMIGRLVHRLGAQITPQIATLLYLTVLTDTGSFRHSNTDAEALRFSAEMVAAGAEPAAIAEAVYGSFPEARVRLMAEALGTLTREHGGRVAWMQIPLEVFDRIGTRDTEDVINQAQGIEGVSVSLLLKETDPGQIQVSMRSDGSVDVADVAAGFGGGGHPRAGGCRLSGDLQSARRRLLDAIGRRL